MGQTIDQMCAELFPVMFDPTVMPMRVNQKDGDDLIKTSACNYYAPGITQAEAEEFYAQRKPTADPRPVMMGMNSRLERNEYGMLTERVWRVGGMYTAAIERIAAPPPPARPPAAPPPPPPGAPAPSTTTLYIGSRTPKALSTLPTTLLNRTATPSA